VLISACATFLCQTQNSTSAATSIFSLPCTMWLSFYFPE
jgi:hypothetical protein